MPTMTMEPKLTTDQLPLGTHFAVQLLKGESRHTIAEAVLNVAQNMNLLFRKLQVLDIITVGSTKYVRMRADLPDLSVTPLVEGVFWRQKRGVIWHSQGVYTVRFNDGRTGKISASVMNISPLIGQEKTYRGTKIKRWEEQFSESKKS